MSSAPVQRARRVVLGLGGCLDYEVLWDSGVMGQLVMQYGIGASDLDASSDVVTERDLVCSILGFVRAGTGGERFVASSGVLEAFAARFERRTTVGGTCVRAALAMATLGVPSTVHLVSIDDQVRSLLPPEVRWVCSADEDTVDPHLIVQVPEGAAVAVGGEMVRARRADRLIYVNDPPNRSMLLSPHLREELAGARVFAVSGFNSMQDADLLHARLDDLLDQMTVLPEGAIVIFEDAGYHRPELRSTVHERLLPYVDVLSMNEDELAELVGRDLDVLDGEAVLAAMRRLAASVPPRTTLVVHTGHWAAALGPLATRLRPALVTAVALAGTRYVYGDGYTRDEVAVVRARARRPRAAEVTAVLEEAEPGWASAVAAAQLQTPTPTTVGLGDTFVGGLAMAVAGFDPTAEVVGATSAGTTAVDGAPTLVALPANQPLDRFYAGGAQVAAFRGNPRLDRNAPEDWIASVTAIHGEVSRGMSPLPSGGLLADAIQRDPVAWLGPVHVAAHGSDPMLLVKLLDAGQRLPVHAHPDRAWAMEHLGVHHGKTEAWIFLEPAQVHLGFARDVTLPELATWVEEQDAAAVLSAMHQLSCRRGDAVVVPAGVPHAIGEGALLVELQEPSDLSVLVEWKGFAVDGIASGHLGVGFDAALTAVHRRGWSRQDVDRLVEADASTTGPLLPSAEGFFRAERSRGPVRWQPGFAVAVVVSGEGRMTAEDGSEVHLRRGRTVLVPYAAGSVMVTGDVEVIRCRPPGDDVHGS